MMKNLSANEKEKREFTRQHQVLLFINNAAHEDAPPAVVSDWDQFRRLFCASDMGQFDFVCYSIALLK